MMTTKLVQKHLLKGTQEFEIIDDAVHVRIKPPLGKEETLTVMLTVLNPEPVISKSLLEFTSRVNNEALLSLHLAKPNQNEFNAFVNLLKQKAEQEFNAFAGLKPGASAELGGNVHEEPPEFDEPDRVQSAKNKKITASGIEEAITMLNEYVGSSGIEDFLASLEALKSEPESDAHLAQMISEFGKLGPKQGAVLSYAPYISVLMSDDPYGNR